MSEGRTPYAEADDPAMRRSADRIALQGDVLPDTSAVEAYKTAVEAGDETAEDPRETDPKRAEAMTHESDSVRTAQARHNNLREQNLTDARNKIANDFTLSDEQKAAQFKSEQATYDSGHIITQARLNSDANQLEETAGAQYDKNNTTWAKFKRGLSRFLGGGRK